MTEPDILAARYTPRDAIPDIRARIVAVWDSLTPSERRVGGMIRFDPDVLLIRSSAEIAAAARTSKATVSRLIRALGFTDAIEIRDAALAARGTGLIKKPSRASFEVHSDIENRNIDAAFSSLDRTGRRGLSQKILSARTVLIVGERSALPSALQLRAQLSRIRPNVRFGPVPGIGLGEEIVDLTSEDLVIVVSLYPHAQQTAPAIDACTESGADVLVIGDPTVAVMAIRARSAIICPTDVPGLFDSHAPVYAVLAAISNDALEAAGAMGRERVNRVASMRKALSEP